jgi:hypothetical protein
MGLIWANARSMVFRDGIGIDCLESPKKALRINLLFGIVFVYCGRVF